LTLLEHRRNLRVESHRGESGVLFSSIKFEQKCIAPQLDFGKISYREIVSWL